MGALSIRNIGDDLIGRLKRRAARHGRSAEGEVRAILHDVLTAEVLTGEVLTGETGPARRGRALPSLRPNCAR